MYWQLVNRANRTAAALADRHYSRQTHGSRHFVPPGRCLVLLSQDARAVWVTSWPFAEYTKHAWAGAWVCSLFRNESDYRASDLIAQAVAATCWRWRVPSLGMITFIDAAKVRPTMRRGVPTWGYCYLKAGFKQVGETKGGLLAFQLTPDKMPLPVAPLRSQSRMAI